MTMHIVFQADKDGYKKDQSCYVERSLARRFCENGIAITHQEHLDNIYKAEQAVIEAKKKEKVEKVKAEVKMEKLKKEVKKKPLK